MAEKRLVCFFYTDQGIQSRLIIVDDQDPNGIASAITELVRNGENKFYNLACVSDGSKLTYNAEYLTSMEDFNTRKHLL